MHGEVRNYDLPATRSGLLLVIGEHPENLIFELLELDVFIRPDRGGTGRGIDDAARPLGPLVAEPLREGDGRRHPLIEELLDAIHDLPEVRVVFERGLVRRVDDGLDEILPVHEGDADDALVGDGLAFLDPGIELVGDAQAVSGAVEPYDDLGPLGSRLDV